MGDMTFREAVQGLRAFHTHCRPAAWQTSDGEAVEAVAEQALAHLEAIVVEREATEQKVYLRYKHSIDPSALGSSLTTSELTFDSADAAVAFIERAWLPAVGDEDGHRIPYESDEDVGRETLNDFRFEVVGIWRVHEGAKQPVPGLADRIAAAKRAKQDFVDTLARRRRLLDEINDKRGFAAHLLEEAQDAEAFLAEHRPHLNEDGVRSFEEAYRVAAEARDRAWAEVRELAARLPKVARAYPGFTVYDSDLASSGPDVFEEYGAAAPDAEGGA